MPPIGTARNTRKAEHVDPGKSESLDEGDGVCSHFLKARRDLAAVSASPAMPLVFNQHFRGTMDYWDPAVTDGLARNREVILFNNAVEDGKARSIWVAYFEPQSLLDKLGIVHGLKTH
jgi:hypothetical protein